jgi:hypothetical protein
MTIPAGPPRRYTTSRQLIAGDDFNNLSDHNYSFQSLTALGANAQATATALNAANVEIAAGTAAGAAKLPVSYPGAEVSVLNNSSNSQQIYGTGTDVVQSGAGTFAAAATGVTLVTLNAALYFCVKKGFWQRAATA